MERRVSVRGIIFNEENHLLAVKHKNNDGSASEYWSTAGGGLDVGESFEAGLEREMIEEFGIKPRIGKLLFVQQFQFTRHTGEIREVMDFFFHIENFHDYEGAIDLSTTSHGSQELARVAFIDPTKEDLLPEFLQQLAIRDYIDGTQPVYVANNLDKLGR